MQAKKIEIFVAGETAADQVSAIVAAANFLAAEPTCRGTASDDGSWAVLEVPVRPKLDPSTLYVTGTDAAGNVAVQCTRSTSDAHADEHIMTAALELSQAVEFRGVTFAEHKLGGLLVRPATNPWQPIPDNLPKGKYLVTVATDSGPCVEILEFDGRGWLHEGEYTFQHGYYFRPMLYQASPAPGYIPEGESD